MKILRGFSQLDLGECEGILIQYELQFLFQLLTNFCPITLIKTLNTTGTTLAYCSHTVDTFTLYAINEYKNAYIFFTYRMALTPK